MFEQTDELLKFSIIFSGVMSMGLLGIFLFDKDMR